jgi:hypothetical protein
MYYFLSKEEGCKQILVYILPSSSALIQNKIVWNGCGQPSLDHMLISGLVRLEEAYVIIAHTISPVSSTVLGSPSQTVYLQK